MRPPTHDDPDAIPREGTDVPWPEIPDLTDGNPASPDAATASEDPADGQTSRETAAQRGS